MKVCFETDSIEVVDVPCTPDAGPPVPATWSDPQPSSLVVTGYDANAFQVVPACPAGTGSVNWNGILPIYTTTGPATLAYVTPGSTFFVYQPFLLQGQSCIMSVNFFSGTHWGLSIRCESSLQVLWAGIKTVGLTPLGTYIRTANAGSATLPACLILAEAAMDWSPLVWVPTLVQPDGTASAAGAGATFSVSATANSAVTNFGKIVGSMLYTGPILGARVRITVTSADTGGFSSFNIKMNGTSITLIPAVGFGVGITDHYFTVNNPASPQAPCVALPIQITAIAQTNVPGNSPAYFGVLQ